MDAARTAEHRGFRGFPTSKSSSSRSCGDTRLRPAHGTAPPGAAPSQGLTEGFPRGTAGNRGATLRPGSQPPPRPTPADGGSGGSQAGRGGLGGAGTAGGRRAGAPGPARRRHWPPARRRSSRTPPRSSYLRGEHTEGAAPPGSDRRPGNEAATRGSPPRAPPPRRPLPPSMRLSLGLPPSPRGTASPPVMVATATPGPTFRPRGRRD